MAIVRKADLADLLGVVALAAHAVAEKTWNGVRGFDPRYVIHAVTDLIAGGNVFVAIADNTIVGIHVLHGQGWVWNPQERFLESAAFYVDPAYRRHTAGGELVATALMKAAKQRASELGAKLIVPVMWGDERVIEMRDEYVRRLGFDYIGGTFAFDGSRAEIAEAAE